MSSKKSRQRCELERAGIERKRGRALASRKRDWSYGGGMLPVGQGSRQLRAMGPVRLGVVGQALLADPELSKLSDYRLADTFGASHQTVREERRCLEIRGQIPVAAIRIGLDGVARDTSRIGKYRGAM